jgi:endonuclease IV
MKDEGKEKKTEAKVVLDVFPTGICGCGQREGENAELFKLVREVKEDFKGLVTVNVAEYGTKIDEAFERLNEVLEASGKRRLANLGLGSQLFRTLIPLIAVNGKMAFVSEVPKKEELYAKINSALKQSSK